MIFESLYGSSQRRELMLVDGGFCHWHLCRNGQVTIREIISQRRGAGSQMINRLKWIPGAISLFAKCPEDLEANSWYFRRGFHLESIEETKGGRRLFCWRLPLRRQWIPNVGERELIYCADGNPRYAEIALDAGWLYGSRLPNRVYYRPYMVDQDWKSPDRNQYMAALAEYRPWLATVLDWETEDQLPEVLDWATEAARYAQVVIIIPKVDGGIARLPRSVGGKPVRLGYSVPTTYGGTKVPIKEFRGWSVHLLGGEPHRQLSLTAVLDVRSMDANYPTKMAGEFGQYWTPKGKVTNTHWPKLYDDGPWNDDIPYEAFKRSCVHIKSAWDKLGAHRESAALSDLPLFAAVNRV